MHRAAGTLPVGGGAEMGEKGIHHNKGHSS